MFGFLHRAIGLPVLAPALRENGDQPRRFSEEWFLPIRAQMRQRIQPIVSRATGIEGFFLLFRSVTDTLLMGRGRYRSKAPGLLVGTGWRSPRLMMACSIISRGTGLCE
jgi:hypothetical protein